MPPSITRNDPTKVIVNLEVLEVVKPPGNRPVGSNSHAVLMLAAGEWVAAGHVRRTAWFAVTVELEALG